MRAFPSDTTSGEDHPADARGVLRLTEPPLLVLQLLHLELTHALKAALLDEGDDLMQFARVEETCRAP